MDRQGDVTWTATVCGAGTCVLDLDQKSEAARRRALPTSWPLVSTCVVAIYASLRLYTLLYRCIMLTWLLIVLEPVPLENGDLLAE